MTESDYRRFHNFLTAHACKVDFRDFRSGEGQPAARPSHDVAVPEPAADTSTDEPLTRAG